MTIMFRHEGSESSSSQDYHAGEESLQENHHHHRHKSSGAARLYNLDDLIDQMEHADVSTLDKVWKLLHRYGWDGSTVTMQQATPCHLLTECLPRHALRAARFLIDQAKVDTVDACQALLHICAHPYPWPDQKLSLVQLLLTHSAHPEYKDKQGRTALQLVYDNKARLDMLTVLAAVTDINQRCQTNGHTLLHKAVADNQDKVVRMLLFQQHGANPNLLDGQGRLPFVVAAHLPTDACLQMLLRAGADVHLRNVDGRTALALTENPAASMLLLRRGARSDVPSANDGVTALHTALDLWCRWRRGENLAVLLFRPYPHHLVESSSSAASTAAGLMDLIVNQAADVNVCDHHGRTPLHYACQVAHTPAPEYVQALVQQKGADITASDKNGWTPLHVAVAFGNYATAAVLVDLGANVQARDVAGRTALHVMGLDRVAARKLPHMNASHAIRLLAFGPEAPPPPYVVPHHHPPEDDPSVTSTHHEQDNEQAPLIQKCLLRGFDFCAVDNLHNLPFAYATDDTLHYLMVHAAACQGLFCFSQKHVARF